MKYKTIASIYRQEEVLPERHFKYCLLKLFQLSNETREVRPFIGYLILTMSFLQIAALIKFHLPKEEIDEFEKDFRIVSLILNYNIYLYKENTSTTSFGFLEYLVYSVTIFEVIVILSAMILIYTNRSSSESTIFIILHYLLQFIQWIGIVPIILILSQVEYDKNNTVKAIFHTLMITLHFSFGLLIAYFNLISTITPYDFFDANDNSLPLDIFFLQVISLILSIIVYHSDAYLFIGYIIVFCFLIKMSYDALMRFMFYKRELAIYLNVLIYLLYERLLNSIIVKYTKSIYGEPFKSYYIPSLLIVVSFNYLGLNLSFKYISNYSLENNETEIRSVHCFIRFSESLLFIIKHEESLTKIKKVGYIINHLNTCEENACPLKQDVLYFPKFFLLSNSKEKIYNDQVKEVHLIMELYRQYYKVFRLNFDYVLSLLKFMLFSFGNLEQLLIEIESATKNLKLSIYQEYILILFKSYANDFIVNISENEVSNKVSKGEAYWSVLIILNVLTYDKVLRRMRHYIYLCLEKKRQLWKLIENEDIIIEELFEIGNDFLTYKKQLNIMWEQLNLISNNNPDPEIANLYCDYLENICEDVKESKFIIEKVRSYPAKTADMIFNNKFKSDTGIVVIKANKEIDLGKIIYINESLTQILGYNQRSELIGNNLKTIIPGTIGKCHNIMLENYFKKGCSNILKKTLGICLKSKNKYLVPVHLVATVIPNFRHEIEGIGLIRLKDNISETFICSEEGIIEGATLLISQLLNITPNFIEKKFIIFKDFFLN